MTQKNDDVTHFGFKTVKQEEKQNLVANVFHDVASSYDIMNDLMSFGLHRIWKWVVCYLTDVKSNSAILDLAGGTGDLTKILFNMINKDQKNSAGSSQITDNQGFIILSDINNSMLEHGRNKLIDNNIIDKVHYVQADAETLPFAENSFDVVTMAFGLRNVTNKQKALESIYRVLKPGGKLFVLEFSKPAYSFIEKIYDFYSFNILPKMAQLVTGKQEHYEYLVESIRMHPDQETLRQMFLSAGFNECVYNNFHAGIVALHRGYKF